MQPDLPLLEHYTLSTTLGEGSYGIVYSGQHKLAGDKVAIK